MPPVSRTMLIAVLIALGLTLPMTARANWDVVGIPLGAPVESVISRLGTGPFARFRQQGQAETLRHETRGAIGRQYRLVAAIGGGEELVVITTNNAGRIAAVVRGWRGGSSPGFSIPAMIEEARRKFGPTLTEADAAEAEGHVIVFRAADGTVAPEIPFENHLANRCEDATRDFLSGGQAVRARTDIPARCGVGIWVRLTARMRPVGGPGQPPQDSIGNDLVDFQALRRMVAGG